MSYPRRFDERRRRVMLTTGAAATASKSSNTRLQVEKMREARRPTVAYGSRVRRCLRGRWYSLVPVQRAALVKTLLVLAAAVIALIWMHNASARYAALAENPAYLDVLRINRYGSLGRYAIGVLYLAVAGVSWLIYQLRRYRNDDFSGNYQLWQWIFASAIVASVANTVPIVAMLGGLIEWALGKRVALSGEDWIELFLMVGGAILAMRTVAEMWRYRSSMLLMVGGWILAAVPTAVQWNVFEVESLSRWTIVTSAPLLAVSFWFASTLTYLRCLFREVRGIEPTVGIVQKMRLAADEWKAESKLKAEEKAEAATLAKLAASEKRAAEKQAAAKPKPTKSTKPVAAPKPASAPAAKAGVAARSVAASRDDESDDDLVDYDETEITGKKSRSWWPFGRKKTVVANADEESDDDSDAGSHDARRSEPARERQAPERQPARSTPQRSTPQRVAAESVDDEADDTDEDVEAKADKPKRSWWPKWKRKPKADAGDVNDQLAAEDEVKFESVAEPVTQPELGSDDDEAEAASKKRRFGLGSLMKRRAKSTDDEDQESDDSSAGQSSAADEKDSSDGDSDGELNEDDIDWSSLNKAERRRMRKQLKRGGRAA
ncbi:hypothetical protein SAMN06265222_11571 [Neorhodopirellula lusitana]|uniref:Uncharacterized protein n=1 Tax=Neorhodopirellula lusitana TaxID=445327 RepID=A0ABY1QKZ0_9BACT|nr:hypothetical protein [Neorhodopirellula lusitana]SMP72369.1 hypothetical protein SAMN06265222_11571 [Neorhodopirellula lusitana]